MDTGEFHIVLYLFIDIRWLKELNWKSCIKEVNQARTRFVQKPIPVFYRYLRNLFNPWRQNTFRDTAAESINHHVMMSLRTMTYLYSMTTTHDSCHVNCLNIDTIDTIDSEKRMSPSAVCLL